MFAESLLESDAVLTKAFVSRILSQQCCARAWCRCVYVFPFFRYSLLRCRAFQVLPWNSMSAASLPEPRLEPWYWCDCFVPFWKCCMDRGRCHWVSKVTDNHLEPVWKNRQGSCISDRPVRTFSNKTYTSKLFKNYTIRTFVTKGFYLYDWYGQYYTTQMNTYAKSQTLCIKHIL